MLAFLASDMYFSNLKSHQSRWFFHASFKDPLKNGLPILPVRVKKLSPNRYEHTISHPGISNLPWPV
jgi:hypothetical protein